MEAYVLLLVFFSLFHRTSSVTGIMGYDCRGTSLNVTTLSLLKASNCEIPQIKTEEISVHIQVLQLSDFTRTMVRQCRVEIDRNIYHCGMHSHVSVVQNGRSEYIHEISRDVCDRMHRDHELHINHIYLTGLRVNHTETRSLTLAGHISNDGTCQGVEYSDPYGTWDKVVVQASIRITLRSFRASIAHDEDQIILPSGQRCQTSLGMCRDNDGSDTYWGVTPTDHCTLDHYDNLYRGQAIKIQPKYNESRPVIYTLTTQETTFALATREKIQVCGYTLIQTEHPKLFIIELANGENISTGTTINVENIDLFTYVNSKFVYVEKHFKTQITELYRDVVKQRCLLEQQVLSQALTLIRLLPDEMATIIMKEPGYTAVTNGEVVHLIKCIPVMCTIRREEHCYEEIPVTHQNQSYFLSPKTHILKTRGTPQDCGGILPTMFQIHGIWYKFVPHPVEALPPSTLDSISKPGWKYADASNLATSGIYTEKDIERLHRHIMFPIEKSNTLHSMARAAMGDNIPPGTINIANLMDENTWDKITETAGTRLWHAIVSFGNFSAGLIGIFIIFKFVKIILDTILHGYILHDAYGCGLHILGALCSSITYLIIHLNNKKTEQVDKETGQTLEAPSTKRDIDTTSFSDCRQNQPRPPIKFGPVTSYGIPPAPKLVTERPLVTQKSTIHKLASTFYPNA